MGMSKAQVETILGSPTTAETKDMVIFKKTTYRYEDGKKFALDHLQERRARQQGHEPRPRTVIASMSCDANEPASLRSAAPALLLVCRPVLLAACQPGKRLTKANVDQVADGMAKKQVESILGMPTLRRHQKFRREAENDLRLHAGQRHCDDRFLGRQSGVQGDHS